MISPITTLRNSTRRICWFTLLTLWRTIAHSISRHSAFSSIWMAVVIRLASYRVYAQLPREVICDLINVPPPIPRQTQRGAGSMMFRLSKPWHSPSFPGGCLYPDLLYCFFCIKSSYTGR